MKLGFKKYKNNSNKNKSNYLSKNYIGGWITFFIFIFLYILLSLIFIYALKIKVIDSLSISSIFIFCFNLIWLILRQNFGGRTKWSLYKTSKKIKMDSIFFPSTKFINSESKGINSYDEYMDYLYEKILYTRIPFWISFSLFSIILLIIIVLAFVLN